jgi:uncharacterized membrane protein YdfJ with MMPL/SSD domain
MRLLVWIIALVCVSYVADAQQPASDAKAPSISRTKAGEGAAIASPLPSSQGEAETSLHAVYYRPGDLKGIAYDSIVQCSKAREKAGNIGVCVIK